MIYQYYYELLTYCLAEVVVSFYNTLNRFDYLQSHLPLSDQNVWVPREKSQFTSAILMTTPLQLFNLITWKLGQRKTTPHPSNHSPRNFGSGNEFSE